MLFSFHFWFPYCMGVCGLSEPAGAQVKIKTREQEAQRATEFYCLHTKCNIYIESADLKERN